MGKRIIVAGAGHGGIAAAYILAQRGFDVTVYERKKREDLGYDWTDIFDKKGFTACGMDIPSRELYNLKHDMTFYGPSFSTALRQHTPEDQLEIQMERKDIYEHLISHALSKGVKFEFETEVKAPILFGNRVVGIKTEKGDIYGDLIIDAAGINSPVRTQLPPSLGIQNRVKEYEQFYVYRGFYNKTAEADENNFKVLLLYENKLGINWIATEEDHTDVLIGRFEPINMDEVNETLESLRKINDSIGTELLRGGQFVNIPVRQPLGILVADGYAAVGDSAFMTVPIIGSGIANSLKAAAILADAVCADKNMSYSAETLWEYQKNFYKKMGSGLAPLACIKLMLTRLKGSELDYIFDNGILNADDMTIGADSTSLAAMVSGMGLDDIKIKLKGLIKNKDVLKKVVRMGKEIVAATAVTAAMPKSYNRKKALKWVKSYNGCFKH
ncbi:MAG: NAD(P)/FAD-dependent oxidoreductase [Clostridiales bacterium]|nr:NAD(P)/FAD-dependent oxidoreductase [Clostridiales bacterium]